MTRSGAGAVLCLCLVVVALVSCDEVTYDNHSPECVQKYQNYLDGGIPTRTYQFFHENMEYTKNLKKSEGVVDIKWRIMGGDTVDISEAPFTVLYGSRCGGCLIAPEWVITAAHCKTNENFIVAGSTKITEGTRYNICVHFVHPKWNEPNKLHFFDYDYQLLLLETPVPVSSLARPIAIGDLSDLLPRTMVSVTGWGLSQVNQEDMGNILRQVSVPIVADEDCKSLPQTYYQYITPRMFCAGFYDGIKDSCRGDSGGPAVANNKLVGTVSFGLGCAEKEKPGVYSNVPFARPWIREVTGLPL